MKFIKLVRKNGRDFFSGGIEYEVGKTSWAPDFDPGPTCGNGLHYGEDIDAGIFNGFPYLGDRNNIIYYPSNVPFHQWTNFLVLEVETRGKTVKICHDKYKAEGLFVSRELPPSEFLPKMLKSKSATVRMIAAAHPALFEIFKLEEIRQLIDDEDIYNGFQINPANPDRLKPGDLVETTPSYSQCCHFPPIKNAELLGINDQRLATIKTRGSEKTIGVDWLRRIAPQRHFL